MNKIKLFLAETITHSLFCCLGGGLLYLIYPLHPIIVSVLFPTVYFYVLYFCYDNVSRFINRKLSVIKILGR